MTILHLAWANWRSHGSFIDGASIMGEKHDFLCKVRFQREARKRNMDLHRMINSGRAFDGQISPKGPQLTDADEKANGAIGGSVDVVLMLHFSLTQFTAAADC